MLKFEKKYTILHMQLLNSWDILKNISWWNCLFSKEAIYCLSVILKFSESYRVWIKT